MAAAAIEPTWTKTLFRPTNRLRDQRREQRGNDSYELPQGLTEVEFVPDVSPEHVLATTGITWEEFCRFLGRDKFVWMGPGVYVCTGYISHPVCRLVVQLGSTDHALFVFAAREPEPETAAATMATFDFLIRLLATSKEDCAYIHGSINASVPISGPGLSHLFPREPRQSSKIDLEIHDPK
jgi:hypothetical protein